jgi:hypothetical protein
MRRHAHFLTPYIMVIHAAKKVNKDNYAKPVLVLLERMKPIK